jgi:putative ABC transport system permease protein
MIRPRFQKVLSDLWGNKVRSILVILSIGVGLFAVGIIATLRVVISDDMRKGYAASNPANLQVTTNSTFDKDLVEHIQHLDGVKDAEGVLATSLRVRTNPNEWTAIDIKAYTDFDRMKINQVKLVEGKFPPEKDEFVVDQYKYPDLNAKVGDWVDVELSNGDTRKLHLVGVIHDETVGASDVGGGFFIAPMQGYLSNDTLAHLELPDVYNLLYVTTTGDSYDLNHINEVGKTVRKGVEDTGRQVVSMVNRTTDEHPNVTYVDAISGVLLLLGFFVVFLSGFLVTNTISALLAQQEQQIGIMKTLGARRNQIVEIYMAVIFIYGILASLIAIPLSSLVANTIIGYLAIGINFTVLTKTIPTLPIILQIAIALIVPQIAGFPPIQQAANLSVQEAISGVHQAEHAVKKNWFDAWIVSIKGFSRLTNITIRNTFRHKGRLLLTMLTLSLGGGVFIATFNERSSLDQYIALISRYFIADVNLTLDRPYPVDRIQQDLSAIPNIKQIEGWAQTRAEWINPDDSAGVSISLIAPPSDSRLIQPVMIKGRWVQPGDQNAIALSERFLSMYPDLGVGDTIRLKINGRITNWVIVGYFQLAGKSGGFMCYTDSEYLSKLINQTDKAVSFRIVATQSGMTTDQQKDLAKQIETLLSDKGYHVSDISSGSIVYTSAAKGLNILTIFLLIMALLIALVGSIGLAGTMSMNVMERTREIGIMRSIGASDRMLYRLVLLEGVFIGLMSWLISAVISFPLSKLLSDTINISLFDSTSGFTFTIWGLLAWLVVVIILSVFASITPARNATRLTIREVLSYE